MDLNPVFKAISSKILPAGFGMGLWYVLVWYQNLTRRLKLLYKKSEKDKEKMLKELEA